MSVKITYFVHGTTTDNKIIIEDRSSNTLENVLFSKEIIDKKFGLDNIKDITTIVKHCHSRRVLMTLKKHFPDTIKLSVYPYEQYGFTKDNWFEHEKGREKVLSEYKKIPIYLAKGDDIIPLLGARNISQLEDSIKSIDIKFSEDDIFRIENSIKKSKIAGPNMPEMIIKNGKLLR